MATTVKKDSEVVTSAKPVESVKAEPAVDYPALIKALSEERDRWQVAATENQKQLDKYMKREDAHNVAVDDLTNELETLKESLEASESLQHEGVSLPGESRVKILFRGHLRDVADEYRKNNYTWEHTALILDRQGH